MLFLWCNSNFLNPYDCVVCGTESNSSLYSVIFVYNLVDSSEPVSHI